MNSWVRLGGLIEGGRVEPREAGLEDLGGVRGRLTFRGEAMGEGKVSVDITLKESSRSEITSGLAGLTRTSLGPLLRD